jgi:hypothetical protein
LTVFAFADMVGSMTPDLLSEIELFLVETGMGPSYFGKVAARNSELIGRLRRGRRVWPETELQVREFIRDYRAASEAAE